MNILETLVQLRDDLKAWVTANLNALNTKIDEKTFPIDSELSSTSTNPVQNKVISAEIDSLNNLVGDTPVATQISTAIASQEHFSGDYNDLTNAPNISEDGSGNMVIADESGNIIFRVDEEGAHTTDVEIDGTSLADKIPVWDAKSDFSGNYNDLVGAPDIAEDGAGNMIVADENGNIIAQVDENGFKTTVVQANQVKIDGQDVVEMIENHTIAIDDALSDSSINPVQNKVIYDKLSELTDMTPVSEQIATAIANKVDKVSGKGLSTNDYTTDEKNKLSGIATGAEVNQNAFSNISVGSTTISADTKTDTLTLVAGSNVTITPDATNDKITIAATDTVYTHPSSGVTACTYKSVTVNAQGHVTAGTNPTTLSGYGITDGATKTEVNTALTNAKSYTDAEITEWVGDKKVSEQIASAQLVYVGPTKPTDPNIKVWINTAEEGTGVIPVIPRISTINLSKTGWSGSSSPYYQTVSINTVTSATKVELNPTVSQIVSLQNDDIALMAQNDAGTVTIYSFGGKPSVDMTIQVTLTEVSYV